MGGKNRTMTKHHILCSSRGGGSEDNLVFVAWGLHSVYHQLFSNLTPEEIIEYLKEQWFTPNRYVVSAERWKKGRKIK